MANTLFAGKHVVVKEIKKRGDGGIEYGLYRPWAEKSLFDVYSSRDRANLVAQYVEEHGGDYSGPSRGAARKYANEKLKEAEDENR